MTILGPYETEIERTEKRLRDVPEAELWTTILVGGDLEPGTWHCYHTGHLHDGTGPYVGPRARELYRRGLALLAQKRLPPGEEGFSYLIMRRSTKAPEDNIITATQAERVVLRATSSAGRVG